LGLAKRAEGEKREDNKIRIGNREIQSKYLWLVWKHITWFTAKSRDNNYSRLGLLLEICKSGIITRLERVWDKKEITFIKERKPERKH
jgi:hypothetical protein